MHAPGDTTPPFTCSVATMRKRSSSGRIAGPRSASALHMLPRVPADEIFDSIVVRYRHCVLFGAPHFRVSFEGPNDPWRLEPKFGAPFAGTPLGLEAARR